MTLDSLTDIRHAHAHHSRVRCPWHGEKDASVQLWDDGTFHCLSCGQKGSWRHSLPGSDFGLVRLEAAA